MKILLNIGSFGMISTSTQPLLTFIGYIKIPNESPFEFKTQAPSESKAKSNALYRYAQFKNLNIAQVRKYAASMGPAFVLEVHKH